MAAAAEYSSFQLAGKLLKVAMTLFYPGAKCIWWLIWTIVLPLAVRHFQPYALLTFVYPHQLVFKPDYWPVEMDTEPHNLLTPAAPPSLPPSSSSLPACLPLSYSAAASRRKECDTKCKTHRHTRCRSSSERLDVTLTRTTRFHLDRVDASTFSTN